MMEYKRLTKWISGVPAIKTYTGSYMTPFDSDVYDAIKRLAELEDKIEQGPLIELPDLTPKFAIVEYYCQKKKPLKVLEYYPCSYEFSTKRIVDCWLCDNMNFRVVIKGFDTREEAEKKLKELQDECD